MKFSTLLPFAAVASAFVIPSEQVLAELQIEDRHDEAIATKDDIISKFEDFLHHAKDRAKSAWEEDVLPTKDSVLSEVEDVADEVTDRSEYIWENEVLPTKDDLANKFDHFLKTAKDRAQSAWEDVAEKSQQLMDDAFSRADEVATTFGDKLSDSADDMQAWLEEHDLFESEDDHHHHDDPDHGKRPHHPPPPHHPPHHGDPHHGHGKPNLTVYQLIAGSKYTTKLAKLINDYPDLVESLNSTKANYTVFAPTDAAFDKIPSHHPKPSKEQLKAVLSYHVVPDLFPAGRVLVSHTAPTLLKGEHLSSQPEPQRIAFKLTLRGLTVNFYSRIVAINILGTNGVIHGVDSLLIPPPRVLKLIDLLPGEFSTLELGLGKTGLLEKLNTTHHAGGTFFAPSNWAFQKLGPRVNAFLFSQYGQKYLKALLEYHVVPAHTLYSDAYYHADEKKSTTEIPKGYFHVDLPTLLKDRGLSVDISRYGGYISMKINGFSSVAVQDGVAEDGVLHLVSSVLIPPKKVGGEWVHFEGGEITEEELMERLEPLVEEGKKKLDL